MSSSSGESTKRDNIKTDQTNVMQNPLPTARQKYLKAYNNFVVWKNAKGVKSCSETGVLAYFKELAKTKPPSTLWSTYLMLKSSFRTNNDIKIETYTKLITFLKASYKSRKSKVFTRQDVESYLKEAPDNDYLATKVALIFGVHGACHANELLKITVDDIEKHSDQLLLIKLTDTNTKIGRSFIIREEYKNIVEKYQALRPSNIKTKRFFLRYRNGKCFKQVIRKNEISNMPQKIARYLNLPHTYLYTVNCFRMTSATLSAGSRANLPYPMRHENIEVDVLDPIIPPLSPCPSTSKHCKTSLSPSLHSQHISSEPDFNTNLEEYDKTMANNVVSLTETPILPLSSHQFTSEQYETSSLPSPRNEHVLSQSDSKMDFAFSSSMATDIEADSLIPPLSPRPSTSKQCESSLTPSFRNKHTSCETNSEIDFEIPNKTMTTGVASLTHLPILPLSPHPSTSKQCEPSSLPSLRNERISPQPDSEMELAFSCSDKTIMMDVGLIADPLILPLSLRQSSSEHCKLSSLPIAENGHISPQPDSDIDLEISHKTMTIDALAEPPISPLSQHSSTSKQSETSSPSPQNERISPEPDSDIDLEMSVCNETLMMEVENFPDPPISPLSQCSSLSEQSESSSPSQNEHISPEPNSDLNREIPVSNEEGSPEPPILPLSPHQSSSEQSESSLPSQNGHISPEPDSDLDRGIPVSDEENSLEPPIPPLSPRQSSSEQSESSLPSQNGYISPEPNSDLDREIPVSDEESSPEPPILPLSPRQSLSEQSEPSSPSQNGHISPEPDSDFDREIPVFNIEAIPEPRQSSSEQSKSSSSPSPQNECISPEPDSDPDREFPVFEEEALPELPIVPWSPHQSTSERSESSSDDNNTSPRNEHIAHESNSDTDREIPNPNRTLQIEVGVVSDPPIPPLPQRPSIQSDSSGSSSPNNEHIALQSDSDTDVEIDVTNETMTITIANYANVSNININF